MERNLLLKLSRGINVQTVARYSIHSGGSRAKVTIFGPRTKVDF